jgi:hypothetical protein
MVGRAGTKLRHEGSVGRRTHGRFLIGNVGTLCSVSRAIAACGSKSFPFVGLQPRSPYYVVPTMACRASSMPSNKRTLATPPTPHTLAWSGPSNPQTLLAYPL